MIHVLEVELTRCPLGSHVLEVEITRSRTLAHLDAQ